jgi:hypothetical protein
VWSFSIKLLQDFVSDNLPHCKNLSYTTRVIQGTENPSRIFRVFGNSQVDTDSMTHIFIYALFLNIRFLIIIPFVNKNID